MEAIAEAYVEIDGEEPSLGALRSLALDHYGHFTAMQVRGGGVRGLDVHLRRLAAQSRELFDEELDPSTSGRWCGRRYGAPRTPRRG